MTMIPQFVFSHGFGEGQGSNLAGLEEYKKQLVGLFPQAKIFDFKESDLPSQFMPVIPAAGPIGAFCNSYGAGALLAWLDAHPNIFLDFAVFDDPVPNLLTVNPPQKDDYDNGIHIRANLGHLMVFREQDAPFISGTRLRMVNAAYGNFQRDDAASFTSFFHGWGTDHVRDKDPTKPLGDITQHFKLRESAWVRQTWDFFVNRKIAEWAPPG